MTEYHNTVKTVEAQAHEIGFVGLTPFSNEELFRMGLHLARMIGYKQARDLYVLNVIHFHSREIFFPLVYPGLRGVKSDGY